VSVQKINRYIGIRWMTVHFIVAVHILQSFLQYNPVTW
jgi:hypothetical protein